MLYLNSKHLEQTGSDWRELIDVIRRAVMVHQQKDFSQPIKPYLRYGDAVNRIIAMPAYIGGDINSAGIKWIASFPKNIERGIQRAHSVTVLNEAETGKALAVFNSGVISAVRTAAVTGLVAEHYQRVRGLTNMTVGMTGFGPIGQTHLAMLVGLFGEQIDTLRIFDLRGVDQALLPADLPFKVEIVDSWQNAYRDCDMFLTCTVSSAAYVDQEPKPGSMHLNVSLRDYKAMMRPFIQHMIVDDWDEVCRESTDVEYMHLEQGLNREDTLTIADWLTDARFQQLGDAETAMFNPMGMAIFDIAIAEHYYRVAKAQGLGVELED